MIFTWKFVSDFIAIFMPIYFLNKIMPTQKKKVYMYYILIIGVLYPVMLLIKEGYYLDIYFKYFIFIITLIYPIVFREGSLSKKIFWLCFYLSGVSTISLLCASIVILLYKNNIIEANYLYSDNFILMRRIIELIYIYIISENIGFIRYVNNKILSVLSFTCIVSLAIINFVGKYIIEYYNYKTYDLVIIVSGMIFLQISIFYIVNSISKIVEEKLVLEINLKSKQNDEDIIRMYKEMIGWRHDMRNHVNTVLGLIERNASNEAIEYIKEVDKRTSDFEKIRYTDNVALDSILTSKINLAKEKGINVKLELNISCEIKLTNIEICTLLGNLLDNSIEACEKLEKDKIIDLKMLAQEDKLIIKIKNNTNGKVNNENGVFKTTKTSGIHGIGLSQINDIIKKYNGYIKRSHENNVFNTNIMINY